MECPKCHKIIPDNATVCPHCRKVLSLTCPNCHSSSKNSICEKCGYLILEKCAKCGKMVPTDTKKCKCGLEVTRSIACNECETDEFASLTVNFGSLKAIRNILSSQELYAKFLVKLKNLMQTQLKNFEGLIVLYGDSYAINFNKELSFSSSANKAVRFALKLLNAFSGLNTRMQEELGCPIKISVVIQKKQAENLLVNKSVENNVKPLMLKKNNKKYLRGMEVIIDQYIQDCISDNYKTDSLYTLEYNGSTVMYYEILLENYILPPSTEEDAPADINIQQTDIKNKTENEKSDIFSFNVFDIKAKCNFEKCSAGELLSRLKPENKIITLKSEKELQINISDLVKTYKKAGYTPLYVSCNDDLCYKPWGFFEKLFKQYYGLSITNGLINPEHDCRGFNTIKNLILGKPPKASTPEDARFAQMELFAKFLTSLKKCVIIIDGFEKLDDTSIQTLDLFFDKFKNINPNFIFITDLSTTVHSKIRGLLRTPVYTEYTLIKNNITSFLSELKEDAADFINSFYYEKIKDNFNGSKIYIEHAMKYLLDKDVLVNFEDKLIIRSNSSVLIPKTFGQLIKARLKILGKKQDASMILAYSVFLGERLDFETLETLGIKNIEENAKILEQSGFTYTSGTSVYINNYSLISSILMSSLKKDMVEMLAKNITGKLGKLTDSTTLIKLMGILSIYKEEYLLLWKNSQSAITTGDYDAYLKNCLGFLSIIDKIKGNIKKDDIENNKKEVFENILMSLYNYSPAKIYSIENILLVDAINKNDDEKIVKLSNLMLQGALISSNYTDALSLLHNILERLENPELIVDGVLNTKFLLLSLINIEILFNIGEYRNCIEIGEQLIGVLNPDNLASVKPGNFSLNLFVSHLLDTFKLVALAKVLTLDDDIENFFDLVKSAFNEDLPEKNCIKALKEFLAGKDYIPSNVEEENPFSKIVFLILQELSSIKDYKAFAMNIYQAKLLAADIHQTGLEYICDLLIAYAYAKIGIVSKAAYIYNDIREISESSAIFNTTVLANYFIALAKIDCDEIEDALIIISDILDELQRHDNQSKVFFAMFEKLYIDTMKNNSRRFNLTSEWQKLKNSAPGGELARIFKEKEIDEAYTESEIKEKPVTEEEYDDLADMASDTESENDDFRTDVHD